MVLNGFCLLVSPAYQSAAQLWPTCSRLSSSGSVPVSPLLLIGISIVAALLMTLSVITRRLWETEGQEMWGLKAERLLSAQRALSKQPTHWADGNMITTNKWRWFSKDQGCSPPMTPPTSMSCGHQVATPLWSSIIGLWCYSLKPWKTGHQQHVLVLIWPQNWHISEILLDKKRYCDYFLLIMNPQLIKFPPTDSSKDSVCIEQAQMEAETFNQSDDYRSGRSSWSSRFRAGLQVTQVHPRKYEAHKRVRTSCGF